MAYREVADRVAHKVAYSFVTRQMHPSLRAHVETFLDRGYGIVEFGETRTTLVREGWFGDRHVTVAVDADQVKIHRN